jgi:hypothetical protein
MSKQSFLEQCKRARFLAEDELKFHEDSKAQFWVGHQKGHIKIITDVMNMVASQESFNKKAVRNFLKKKKLQANTIIKELDKTYNDLCIDMLSGDEETYSINSGIDCEATFLQGILNGKCYYDKGSYIPTDWGKEFSLKKDIDN